MPAVAESEPRSQIVQFAAPPAVRAVIRRLAERECSSQSEVIRRSILARAREAGIEPAGAEAWS